MFNTSIDGYGSVRKLAAVQNAGGQIAIDRTTSPSGLKPVVAAENTRADIKPVAVDKTELVTAVKKLNELVAPALQTVQFSLDEQSERMVVKVVDTASKQVLRQIPNEEVLAMSKTLDKLQGLMIRQTA
ncbi:flagellar protein FlaG [Methylotenera sp.]|uniref:flagellar protein FlaG n=1 Tax=Methylotenera sp. TaxID=2051956 RepID=UPI00273117C5|nr:flagellar protein FlaG [Methylotenera sp.]MDP1522524.1 flagellar protein FlaG [Methylotenera sp.]MDP3308737.1 flagellar protein FlaG [Methylotenera sp.]